MSVDPAVIVSLVSVSLAGWAQVVSSKTQAKEQENAKAIESLEIAYANVVKDNERLMERMEAQDKEILRLQDMLREEQQSSFNLRKEFSELEQEVNRKEDVIKKLKSELDGNNSIH